MGLGILELPTSPLSGVRSSHLSYRPGFTVFRSSALSYELSSFDRAKLGARRSQLDVFEDKVERASRLSREMTIMRTHSGKRGLKRVSSQPSVRRKAYFRLASQVGSKDGYMATSHALASLARSFALGARRECHDVLS